MKKKHLHEIISASAKKIREQKIRIKVLRTRNQMLEKTVGRLTIALHDKVI